MKVSSDEGGGGYRAVLYSLIVIVMWGLVPAFAKLGALPGGLTTMYVNWFAVAGILAIMVANGSIKRVNRQVRYGKIALVGLIWPLAYSIAYFTSIDLGTSSMTTITNYTWPVFYLLLATFLLGRDFPAKNWLVVGLAVLGVVIPMVMESNVGGLMILPILLGLTAAFSQALYSLVTESWEENAWLITLVVEVVTAVGATIYVLAFESFQVPSGSSLGYLAFIGVLSNGVGFWAFLRAGQVSARAGSSTKTLFLVLMCLTPLVQVVVLPLLKVEQIGIGRWAGVILITIALYGHRVFLQRKQD